MYFKEFLKQYDGKKIKIFVEMDNFGKPCDYDKKRPLYNNINQFKEISNNDNIELYIFSVTRMSNGYEQKQYWLDKYAPFFKKENRIIISRESNDMTKTAVLKAEYLRDYKRDGSVLILIDDDPRNLKEVHKLNEDIILLKDTVLED